MLMRALLSRMNGGTNAASKRISSNHRRFSKLVYEKYPNLPDLILGLLSSGSKKTDYSNENSQPQPFAHSLDAERILPALEMVERSGLPSNHSLEIHNAIRQHRQSPVWAIREKSAKALAAVVEERNLIAEIRDLLKINCSRQNALHGSLLCARFMIARLGAVSTGKFTIEGISRPNTKCAVDKLSSLLPQFITSFDIFVTNNDCPLTAASYLDIIADVYDFLNRDNSKKIFQRVHTSN